MNRMIRGVAGLMVALGASACVNDPSVDYANDPSKIVLDPHTMFVTHGTEKQVFARLADERNRATPTEFQISNVSAGLTVRVDSTYRMDYINGDSLSWRPVQHQHRLWVGSTNPQGAMGTFTVSAQGISTTATVRILPADLGAALSKTAPDLGEAVTLTAPANLSFTDSTTITFTPGGAAVITERSAKSITFLPRPGSQGPATVSGISLDYAPTLAARTLTTTNEISVESVGQIQGTWSSANPALGAPITFTSTQYKFPPNTEVRFGGNRGVITSIAADSSSITVIPPPGATGAPTITNARLAFLLEVPLAELPTNGTVTTAATAPALPNVNPVADDVDPAAPVMNLGPAGQGAAIIDGGPWTGADALGGGGPNRWYKLVAAGPTATRTLHLNWEGGADLDLWLGTAALSQVAYLGTVNHPEQGTASIAAGNYVLVAVNWNNTATPAWVYLMVQ